MSIQLTRAQARHFLARYHFAQSNLPGIVERLGTIQYDPLNPVGRNPDLVFQARVPAYQVDDWQKAAYTDRILYDAWDKQACLVPISDWPWRAITREHYRPYHDREIIQSDPETAQRILATLDAQGPLSSLEFEDRTRIVDGGSWSGLTRTKQMLRAMWACGLLLTHHRRSGRHYYARPELVIPAQHYQTSPIRDTDTYHRWILSRRFQATGLLRANAEACIWSSCGESAVRKKALQELIAEGILTAVRVEDSNWLYAIPGSLLPLLDVQPLEPRVIFIGPLDSILWDRKGVQHIFGFDYIWEVYKPLEQRRWGYYVLPVFYGDRFIARFDSKVEDGVLKLLQWWWEPDVQLDEELLRALKATIQQFLYYLRAKDIWLADTIDRQTKKALSL